MSTPIIHVAAETVTGALKQCSQFQGRSYVHFPLYRENLSEGLHTTPSPTPLQLLVRTSFPRACLDSTSLEVALERTQQAVWHSCAWATYHHTHSVRTPTGNHRQLANDFLTKTTVSLGKMSPHVWWFCCCLICSVLVCVRLWMKVQLKARCLGSAGAGVTSGCLKWALGTELGSSARLVHALKHWAIFAFLTSWYWFLLRAQVWTTSKSSQVLHTSDEQTLHQNIYIQGL